MPFINFSLCPEGASSLLMPRNAGYKQAVRWLMLGEQFGAQDACDAGILTQVVADGEAQAHAGRAVARLLALNPVALRTTKQLMRRTDSRTIEAVLEQECASFVQLLASPSAQSALSAFASRSARQPGAPA